MNYFQSHELKKATSGVGFLTLAAFGLMIYLSVVLVFLSNFFDFPLSEATQLWSGITSLCSMFALGLIYTAISPKKLSELIPLKKVKAGHFVPLVLIAAAVAMVSNYATEILLNNLSLFGIENGLDMDYSSPDSSLLYQLLTILSVAVIPPLAEEFMFRGLILNRLKPYGINYAIITSSLLFGLMHGNIVQIPFAFVVGLGFAFVTVKSGSILPSVTAHFLVNFSSVMYQICEGAVDEKILTLIYLAYMMTVLAGGIISAKMLSKEKGFFNIFSNKTYNFKQAMVEGYTSAGMILTFVAFLIEVLFSTQIWGMSIL